MSSVGGASEDERESAFEGAPDHVRRRGRGFGAARKCIRIYMVVASSVGFWSGSDDADAGAGYMLLGAVLAEYAVVSSSVPPRDANHQQMQARARGFVRVVPRGNVQWTILEVLELDEHVAVAHETAERLMHQFGEAPALLRCCQASFPDSATDLRGGIAG